MMLLVAWGMPQASGQGIEEAPVERDDLPVRRPTTTTSPTTRFSRPPATQLSPSKRRPSKPTTKPTKPTTSSTTQPNAFDLKPSRITLRMKGTRADTVFEELSKQSGAIFELTPELWRDVIPKVDQVEIIDEPFWPALRRVLVATGTQLQPSEVRNPESGLIPIGPLGGNPGDRLEGGVVADSLLVQVVLTNRTARVQLAEPEVVRRTGMIAMHLFVEPKFDAVPLTPTVWLDRAEDDQGRPIEAAPLPAYLRPEGRVARVSTPRMRQWTGMCYAPLQLKLPAADSKRIAKFKARAEYAVMTSGMEIQIPDILNVAGTELHIPGGPRLLVHEATQRAGSGDWFLRFTAWSDGMDPAKWDPLRRGFLAWASRARFETSDGQTVFISAFSNMTTTTRADAVEAELAFRLPRGAPQANCRFVWIAPASAAMLSLPFELTDVPLAK